MQRPSAFVLQPVLSALEDVIRQRLEGLLVPLVQIQAFSPVR